MNAVSPTTAELAPPLAARLFALLSPSRVDAAEPAEALWLAAQAEGLPAACFDLSHALALWQAAPPLQDEALHRLSEALSLNDSERMALALCHAADTDVIAGRALAWLQAPQRDMHPTLGLMACLDVLTRKTRKVEG